MNYFSVFHDFVGLALEGLTCPTYSHLVNPLQPNVPLLCSSEKIRKPEIFLFSDVFIEYENAVAAFHRCSSKACNFLKKRVQHRCFPVKFGNFLRTRFVTEHLRWVLLKIEHWPKMQGCKQELIREGDVSWNKEVSMNISFKGLRMEMFLFSS